MTSIIYVCNINKLTNASCCVGNFIDTLKSAQSTKISEDTRFYGLKCLYIVCIKSRFSNKSSNTNYFTHTLSFILHLRWPCRKNAGYSVNFWLRIGVVLCVVENCGQIRSNSFQPKSVIVKMQIDFLSHTSAARECWTCSICFWEFGKLRKCPKWFNY